jgi:tyrosinase
MANELLLRKSVDLLSPAELAALRGAYAKMQQITDNRGFNYWAGLHGTPGNYCWHAPRRMHGQTFDLFLPWHRAYLLNFEQFVRDQDATVTVPWWDWTSQISHTTGVPQAFSDQTDSSGQPNPLLKSHITVPQAGLDRDTTRFPGDPSQLPQESDLDNLYTNHTQFADFSDQLQDIHNNVHGWTGGIDPSDPTGNTGGDMGVIATAAFDPIFWSHHVQIDRIWYIWQVANGVSNIPTNYLTTVLAPFTSTVQDVLDIHGLGYDYAGASVTTS